VRNWRRVGDAFGGDLEAQLDAQLEAHLEAHLELFHVR